MSVQIGAISGPARNVYLPGSIGVIRGLGRGIYDKVKQYLLQLSEGG
jgi:hypothetical protein